MNYQTLFNHAIAFCHSYHIVIDDFYDINFRNDEIRFQGRFEKFLELIYVFDFTSRIAGENGLFEVHLADITITLTTTKAKCESYLQEH